MNDYRERFVEAEDQASKLLDQLELLKIASEKKLSATESLKATRDEVHSLLDAATKIIRENQSLISTLKDIDTEKILNATDDIKNTQKQIVSNQDELTAQIQVTKDDVGKSSLKISKLIYIQIGLMIIIGILNLVMK